MSLKEAFEKLVEKAADFSSLEVVTLTGDVKAIFQQPAAGSDDNKGNIIDWTKAVEQAKVGGEVKLALASKYNFDGDATLFVSETAATPKLIEAHSKAVQSGKDIRTGIFELFSDTITDLVKKI